MARLALPIQSIKAHYDAVVIGSGYGGAIAASRLARVGLTVCVLERGREIRPGEYPENLKEFIAEIQTDGPACKSGSKTGLYDFRLNSDINVLVGCGLGGTSLINANVALEPDPRVFLDTVWPEGLRSDADGLLKQGFEEARRMLKPAPYPSDRASLAKQEALRKSNQNLRGDFYPLDLNVTFEEPPNRTNHVGEEQTACTLCGDCFTGCNHRAKNTVLMNYLPDARRHGAEIFTEITVRRIESAQDGRWLVYFDVAGVGREHFRAPDMFVLGKFVVLAAGTLGSTEILLRSRQAGLRMSDRVGERFTGNGDFAGLGFNCDDRINGVGFGSAGPSARAPVGPTITSVIDTRKHQPLDDGFVLEEGAIAGPIASLLGGAAFLSAAPSADPKKVARFAAGTTLAHTQTYLAMAHDDANGRMVLENDRVRIHWPGVGKQAIFRKLDRAMATATEGLGGTHVTSFHWRGITHDNLTTVHPLGGCALGENGAQGVVNHKGQVFSSTAGTAAYSTLYVADGSVIPRSLGVNPLLTISALAERTCDLLVREHFAKAIDRELPPATLQQDGSLPVGVVFTESMKGTFAAKDSSETSFQFILTIRSDNLEAMIRDSRHECRMTGSVIAPALSTEPLTVTAGTFNLFVVNPDKPNARKMEYGMTLTSKEGRTFRFYGWKDIHRDTMTSLDFWPDTTTLHITVFDESEHELGAGTLRIFKSDFAIQLTTIKVLHASSTEDAIQARLRFGRFFFGSLFELYGLFGVSLTRFRDREVPRTRRTLDLPEPEVHVFWTSDRTQLSLTRYNGGSKGPVILAPGFGTSTLAFSIDTLKPNLPEFLVANGYDTWLFDYRASPALASSWSEFTMDDIARQDWPAAIKLVSQSTGSEPQVLAHCMGSMTLLMALLSGIDSVRFALCSAVGLYPRVSAANRLKALLKLPTFAKVLGTRNVTTHFSGGLLDTALNVALTAYPSEENCGAPTCRRILGIYGEVYNHGNLDNATHLAIDEMFGIGNTTAYQHILRIFQKQRIVDSRGHDIYLPNVPSLKTPITFLHGDINRMFDISGTAKTVDDLNSRLESGSYKLVTLRGFAHLDTFIGRDAPQQVFPVILRELEAH